MPEQYAAIVYPLVDALMREAQYGTPSSALAKSLVRRLTTFGAKVTVASGRNRNAVTLHWGSEPHHAPKHNLAVTGDLA
jgi:hypothetical protein